MTRFIMKSRVIILIALAAFALRFAYLPDNLFFGWEQGRDFLKMKEILAGDMVLVGPKTDIGGVFHGALSYYIPLLPFAVSAGDPLFVLGSYLVIHSVSIIFLYKAVRKMFSERVALLSGLFYAVSYSSIIFSRWLSNPNLVPVLAIIIFYSLVKSRENWKYLLVAAFAWAVTFHLLVVAAIILILPILLFLWFEKIKLSWTQLLWPCLVLGLTLSPYLLFELRNNFIMTESFMQHQASIGSLAVSGLGFFDQFLQEVVDNLIPLSPRFSFLFFIIVLFFAVRKLKFNKNAILVFSFLLASPAIFLVIGTSPLRHFYIIVPVFLSVTVALVVDNLLTSKKYKNYAKAILVIVVLGNLSAYAKRVPVNKANFIHHAQRTYLGDQKNLVDWVYAQAQGAQFSYDYYTVPYFLNDAWHYLFTWYGQKEYGYSPVPTEERTDPFYVVIEPNEGIKVHQDNWYGEFKKNLELPLAEAQFGKLKAEKRTPVKLHSD